MFDLVEEILSDYICYLKESGYLEMGQLADYLRGYFSSEAFSSIIRGWLDTLDPENRDEAYLTGKIDELSDLILQSLNSYLNMQGLPGLPFLENAFREYLGTGRWRGFAQAKIIKLMEDNQLDTKLNAYIDYTIRPLVERGIANAMQQFQLQLEVVAESITLQMHDSISTSITNGFTSAIIHAEECVSMDMDRFLDAFSMKLDTQELSDILLSLTNFSKVTLSKNLKKLGYAEMSHPKSIKIYPHDFESKDAVIAVLDRYNQNMELLGKKSDTISYTDTLGTVMGTVTRIITIITSALIATVAVSLVVSSIMIGVITYISVLERRKEIGILRAMGASKHNIAQIFNAETFITGFVSGCMGVGLAYLLIMPLNAFLHRATQIQDIGAFLPGKYALMLIVISVVLTTIGGIIPAHNASKSDPVEALRTE